jgi:hypothetical protein
MTDHILVMGDNFLKVLYSIQVSRHEWMTQLFCINQKHTISLTQKFMSHKLLFNLHSCYKSVTQLQNREIAMVLSSSLAW